MKIVHDNHFHVIAPKKGRNYINSLLDQEQTDDTTSNTIHLFFQQQIFLN